jgi:hypothetical protein
MAAHSDAALFARIHLWIVAVGLHLILTYSDAAAADGVSDARHQCLEKG